MEIYICKNCEKEFKNYLCNIKTDNPCCSRSCSAKFQKCIPPSRKGIKCSEKFKIIRSLAWMGSKNPNYIKDRTQLKRFDDTTKDRRSSAYGNWRKEIWKRDGFKCKINNKDCNDRIEAHHILGFTKYPELRYDINNGITLCHFHHPRVREEEKRLIPTFQELVSVSKV